MEIHICKIQFALYQCTRFTHAQRKSHTDMVKRFAWYWKLWSSVILLVFYHEFLIYYFEVPDLPLWKDGTFPFLSKDKTICHQYVCGETRDHIFSTSFSAGHISLEFWMITPFCFSCHSVINGIWTLFCITLKLFFS